MVTRNVTSNVVRYYGGKGCRPVWEMEKEKMAIDRLDLNAGGVDFSGVAGGDKIAPIHPGEILGEMIRSRNITPYRVAKDSKMPLTRLTAILGGNRAITADTSIRLGKYFGQSPAFWLNLQAAYGIRKALADADAFQGIEPLVESG